jgi:6,7-dimethyl-8-ribityllumazine synthase|tara:strand:+ start:203 stop:667 length:465 start_codon:yes stop_codon:yes gene_type:complete
MDKNIFNITVISSEFNADIVNNLYLGVEKFFKEKCPFALIEINEIKAPGSFELPYIAKRVLEKKNTDCIITLGCIIKGETAHFEYISNACANTLSQLTIQSEIPIMFGVITAYNREQAIARSQVDFDNKDNLNIGFNVANAAAQTLISKKIHKL